MTLRRNVRIGLATLLCCTSAAAAQAQTQLNPEVRDYAATMFQSCIPGTDLGAQFGASNPALLIGSIVWHEPTVGDQANWRREPVAISVVSGELPNLNRPTCDFRFELTQTTSANVFGIGLEGARSDVFEIRVRQLIQQRVDTVPENGINISAWRSLKFRPAMTSIIMDIPPGATEISFVANTTTYIVELTRYRRTNASAGLFGILAGNARYLRDETFQQARLVVTGDRVPLARTAYPAITPGPAVPTPPTGGR